METNMIPYDYSEVVVDFLEDISGVVKTKGEEGTPEEKLRAIIGTLGDLFSLETPTLLDNPEDNIRQIVRSTKLANIAREKAMYRLYLMTIPSVKIDNGSLVPMWWALGDVGLDFETQEDFIDWFTKQSGIGRASTFRRLRVYQRLEKLGISGKDAWMKVLKMPSTMQEIVQLLAKWNRSEFMGVDERVALDLAKGVLPEAVPGIEAAFQDGDIDKIAEAYFPVAKAIIQEAETYESAKDAMQHIKHDILGTPTVAYRWSVDEQTIVATVTTPIIDNGTVKGESQREIALFIDALDPPQPLLDDIFKRIPITNRHDLPS